MVEKCQAHGRTDNSSPGDCLCCAGFRLPWAVATFLFEVIVRVEQDRIAFYFRFATYVILQCLFVPDSCAAKNLCSCYVTSVMEIGKPVSLFRLYVETLA
ncbi:uncharacterized protein LOC130764898 isoform X2 [Actinidia eriantha]|uniref:uncharacterized protein LOC130764898 isoform X2 n=1 Tax=Actinidia eriantha TaxID=165200 RepID=UPI00258A1615|nr:uncharacterized protein LOC130764898 isoform X2 [Actinidia eriantha]